MADNRKSKIVDPKLQYKEAIITVMVFIITVNITLVLSTVLTDQLRNFSPTTFLMVAAGELIFVIAMWRASIRSSHRMVGPVYAMEREIAKLSEGDLTVEINLRADDNFQSTANAINEGISHLRNELIEIKGLASSLAKDDNPAVRDEILKRLGEIKTN